MQEIIDYIKKNLEDILKIVISSPRKSSEVSKISVRKLGGGFQIEEFKGNKVLHYNVGSELPVWLEEYGLSVFRQHTVYLGNQTATFLLSNRGKVTKRLSGGAGICEKGHNNDKNYLVSEGMNVQILRDLGVFTGSNKVAAPMYGKFRQINRFIEIIDDVIKGENNKSLTILDFGCGKSYLTFVLYHYLTFIRKIETHITGYDLKSDVVESSNALAKKYRYDGMEFICGDILKSPFKSVDIMIALHACDVATDYALFKAITSGARHIFCAPCCQHEINSQIKNDSMDFILRHGVLRERFSAVMTDATRAEILDAYGYKTQIIEFVDQEHSQKNLMLRASLRSKRNSTPNLTSVENLLREFNCTQTLYKLMSGQNEQK